MRSSRLAVLTVALLVALGACTTGPDDYKNQTEDYIEEDSDMEQLLGADAEITDAECEEPADTEIGTRYACTALVDGVETVFEAEIENENAFVVRRA